MRRLARRRGVGERLPNEVHVLIQQVVIPACNRIDDGYREVSQPIRGNGQILACTRGVAGDVLAKLQQLETIEHALFSLLDERVDLLSRR